MRYEDGALYLDVTFQPEERVIDVNVISDNPSFDFTIDGSSQAQLPWYEGNYEVDPKVLGQELETANKSMHENVVINPIYFTSVTNPSGGNTVFIGQE